MSVENEDVTVAQLMEFACTNIPAGWGVQIWLREGASGVEIARDGCDTIDVRQGAQTVMEMVVKAVNGIRLVCGLEAVDFIPQRESLS